MVRSWLTGDIEFAGERYEHAVKCFQSTLQRYGRRKGFDYWLLKISTTIKLGMCYEFLGDHRSNKTYKSCLKVLKEESNGVFDQYSDQILAVVKNLSPLSRFDERPPKSRTKSEPEAARAKMHKPKGKPANDDDQDD